MNPRVVLAVALLAACSHAEPYGIPTYGGSQPYRDSLPVIPFRLTYSTLNDSEASWLPDGSALLYTALRADFPDSTYCLELLPPAGGQIVRSWCPTGEAPPDSARALQAGAVSPGGRLLVLRSARTPPRTGWSVRQLLLTDLAGTPPRVLLATPFPQYTGISQIRWVTEDRFVFRADLYAVNFPQGGGLPYESSTGLYLVAGSLTGDSATFTIIGGTGDATSVAVADSDTILYTLAGNTQLFWRSLSSGAAGTVRDFAPYVPDAVQLSGRWLALTLGGMPAITRRDSSAIEFLDNAQYNGLALSPDGRRLVAQRQGDLYEFVFP